MQIDRTDRKVLGLAIHPKRPSRSPPGLLERQGAQRAQRPKQNGDDRARAATIRACQ